MRMFPHSGSKEWSVKLAPYYDLTDFASVFGRMEAVFQRHGATVRRESRNWKLSFAKPPKRALLESITSDINAAWHGIDHVSFMIMLPPGYFGDTKPIGASRLSKTEVQVLSRERFKKRLTLLAKRKQKHKELLWWLEGIAARTPLPIDKFLDAMEGVVK